MSTDTNSAPTAHDDANSKLINLINAGRNQTPPQVTLHAAKACGYSRAQCESAARELQSMTRARMPKPIAREIGGTVDFHKSMENLRMMTVRAAGDFTINAPGFTSVEWDNYYIARLLGHYALHFPRVMEQHPGEHMRIDFSSNSEFHPDADALREAIWFANELLIPEAKLRPMLQKLELKYVAVEFNVSLAHLKRRIAQIDPAPVLRSEIEASTLSSSD